MDRNRWQLMLVIAVLVLLVAGTLRVAGAQSQPEELCQGEFLPVAPPLTELGNDEYVRMEGGPTGFTGGLYPDGANERPPDHEAAGLAASARIQPLNEAGQPDPAGKIVLMSVGMSNTTSEFGAFSNLVHEQRLDNPDSGLPKFAGLIVEPVIGHGGWIVPPAEFLSELRRITAERGILLVVDEIITDLGVLQVTPEGLKIIAQPVFDPDQVYKKKS